MSEIDETMALNQEIGEETNLSTTPVEETQTTDGEPEFQETQPEQPESSESGKKGYSQRVQELANKAKAEKVRADSLAAKLAELTGSVDPSKSYNPQVSQDADAPFITEQDIDPVTGQINLEQINKRMAEREKRILQTAGAQTQILTQQSKLVDQINKEARGVVKKYAQLNPDSEQFNPNLSGAITKATEAYLRANPTASVKKFVDELMEPYQASVQKEVGDQQQEITKQVAQTALRPTSIKQSEKTTKDMSIAELESRLGIVQA